MGGYDQKEKEFLTIENSHQAEIDEKKKIIPDRDHEINKSSKRTAIKLQAKSDFK